MEDNAWIQTATGRQFTVREPSAGMIDPLDIAHALAHTCRFNGHCQTFYSVAQHCCTMVAMLRRQGETDKDVLRWALLHDADEAYLPDVPRPVKPLLFVRTPHEEQDPPAPQWDYVPWATFAGRIMRTVAMRFRLFPLTAEPPEIVKRADLRMLATEKRDLLGPEPAEWVALRGIVPYTETIEPIRPELACEQFLNLLREFFPREKVPYTARQLSKPARSGRWFSDGKF